MPIALTAIIPSIKIPYSLTIKDLLLSLAGVFQRQQLILTKQRNTLPMEQHAFGQVGRWPLYGSSSYNNARKWSVVWYLETQVVELTSWR